jgi:hypothetical protein
MSVMRSVGRIGRGNLSRAAQIALLCTIFTFIFIAAMVAGLF